jgi:hypothetical protein
MKKKSKKLSVNRKGLINTIHVFSTNDQVYLKKRSDLFNKEPIVEEIIWSPINFHWEPMIALKKELKINK